MNGCNQKQLLPLAVPSHPLYRIRRNYDDKWDTIEYRNIYDQYICSAYYPSTHERTASTHSILIHLLLTHFYFLASSHDFIMLKSSHGSSLILIISTFMCVLRSMSRGYCHKASERSRQSKPCEPISAIEFMPWGHTWWSCLKFHASLYQYIRFIFDPSVFDLHCTTYTYKLFWTTSYCLLNCIAR